MQALALSVILHAANTAAFAVPTSLYYDGAEVSMKQVCIELSCTEAEVLTTGNGWTAYVKANAADYTGNKRNHLAEQELAKLTDFDFTEAGGIYGPVLVLKDADTEQAIYSSYYADLATEQPSRVVTKRTHTDALAAFNKTLAAKRHHPNSPNAADLATITHRLLLVAPGIPAYCHYFDESEQEEAE